MTRKIETSTPRIGVMLYPYEQHFRYSPSKQNSVKKINATDYITSVQFLKSKGQASGTFTITLKAVKNWRDVIKPGDWLLIYHSRFPFTMGDTKGLKVLGNVDRVSRDKTTKTDGTKEITYTITGRDFGKILEETRFYFNPFLESNKAILDFKYIISKTGEKKIVGTPESFVRTYFDLFFNDGGVTNNEEVEGTWDDMDQLRIPSEIMKVFGVSGKKLGDLIHIKVERVDGYSWSTPTSREFDGSVWEILKSVSNPMMNELYTSLEYIEDKNGDRKLVPCIVLRELPYSKGIYNKLNTHRIDESVVISEDLGFSDHERYNFLFFNFLSAFYDEKTFALALAEKELIDLGPGRKKGSLIPFIDSFSIQRYGLRKWTGQTKYCYTDGSDEPKSKTKEHTDITLGIEWQKKLIDWWSNLVRTESGTIVIKAFGNEYNKVNWDSKVVLKQGTIKPETGRKLSLTVGKIKDFFKTTVSKVNKLQKEINDRFSIDKVDDDHLTVGNNIYNSDSGILYQLEAYSLEWAAPGFSQVSLTVTRGVKGVPGNDTYEFLDDLKDLDKQEVTTTFIKRGKKGDGDKE